MVGQILNEIPQAGIGLITIDRPEKRNAMTAEMISDFTSIFGAFASDDNVSVIIITGTGDAAFSAGHDIKAIADGELDQLYGEEHMQVFLLPRQTTKPVICALNGSAYAGGFCLAIACDLRIAVPETTFAVPGPRLGIVPIAGQSSRLVRLLPPAVANEMVMCGRTLTADRAESFGFVNEVVPRSKLLPRAIELASEISAMSQFAIQSYKRIALDSVFHGNESADAMEYWLAMKAGHSPDVEEGLAAFRERRAPKFDRAGDNK